MSDHDTAAAGAVDIAGGAPIVVTGAAGFIGHHVSARLLRAGASVIGVDNFNAYYDPELKEARLRALGEHEKFRIERLDLADAPAVAALVDQARPRLVIHLAAQAGVRYSLQNPFAYVDANLSGFLAVLEACRAAPPLHLLYASSSSVYGGNEKRPYAVEDAVDHPVSLYAATKKANELFAHTYSHLYEIPATGLRFFTVYGPFGRPDMAYYSFTEKIFAQQPIQVFNHGRMKRDFTYIDDIVEAVLRLCPKPPAPRPQVDRSTLTPADSWAPHRVFNLGNDRPETLMDFISILEREIGVEAEKIMKPMQPGDVLETWADVSALEKEIGWRPSTPLSEGLSKFVTWYRGYHGNKL